MKKWLGAALLALLMSGVPLAAAERGAVTDLPLPRYVSLKASEGNARRGPGLSHRVDWIYRLRDMPLRVTAEYEHWRRVEDPDGQGGWMHYALLSGVRTALITKDLAALRTHPHAQAQIIAHIEAGVVARLMNCAPGWCQLRVGTTRGWVEKPALWGVDPEETID